MHVYINRKGQYLRFWRMEKGFANENKLTYEWVDDINLASVTPVIPSNPVGDKWLSNDKPNKQVVATLPAKSVTTRTVTLLKEGE